VSLSVRWIGHRPKQLEAHFRAAGVALVAEAPIVFHVADPNGEVPPRAREEQWRVAVVPGAAWDAAGSLVEWLDRHDFDDAVAAERWPTECLASLRRALRHDRLRRSLETLEAEAATLSSRTEEAIQQLEASVRMATGVQRVLLSRVAPRFSGVDLQFKYVPGKGAGGDYYDFVPLDDGKRFVLLLADGRSHGVVAGLLSALLRLTLSDIARLVQSPEGAIRHFRDAIAADGDPPEALDLAIAVFDRPSLTLAVAHTAPTLAPAHLREGAWTRATPDAHGILRLRPGDRLCFASSGIGAIEPGGLLPFLEALGRRDPLDTQNELMARVRSRKALPADLTFLQVAVDARALFVAT
jgi:hypothetical protein